MLSTPTVPGHGIDSADAWEASDQHRWEVPCPHCGRYQVLSFDENVKLGDVADECVVECQFCNYAITDESRYAANASGRWVPMNLNGNLRGYHISQLNSPTQPLTEIVKGWYLGQKNVRALKSFFNQSLGLPFIAPGDKLTEQLLDGARKSGLSLGGIPNGPISIGVDVGTFLHVMAYTMDRFGNQQLWQMHQFKNFDELDRFFSRLINFSAVIDAHPEKHAARDLAIKYHGKVWVGFEDDRPQTNEIAAFQPLVVGKAGKVVIDRTMAFDQVVADFTDGKVFWPMNARDLGEQVKNRNYNGLYYQMLQMVRVEEENTRGTIVARWRKNRNADHWHHSHMFARIAMMRRPTLHVPASISNALNRSFVGAA